MPMHSATTITCKTATAFLAFLLIGSAESVQSQILQRFNVRPENFGARAMGIGEATVADANDVSSMYGNPATLEFLQYRDPVVNSRLDANSQMLNNGIAFAFRTGMRQMLAVGLVASYYGSDVSKPEFASYGFDLAFAARIVPTLSAGAFLDLRYGSMFGSSFKSGLLAASGSVGLLYSPNRGISYGITYRGFGSGIIFLHSEDSVGVKYEHQLPQSIEAGLTFRFPLSGKHPFLVISMAADKSLMESTARNKVGLEISPFDYLSVRLGLVTNDPTTVLRAGVGAYLLGFHLDYAISPSKSLEGGQQLSISVPLVN